MLETLFGNETAAKILLYLANYGEGSIAAIGKSFGMHKNRVYTQLLRLESGGILVGRTSGNQRIFSFNPRFILRKELVSFLQKWLNSLPREEFDQFFAERRRPRRTGKDG